MTFHFACNYGAVLQCYALQRYLSMAGHEVSVIDYRPEAVADGYRWFDIRRFWGATPVRFWHKTLSEVKVIGKRRRRYAAFDTFVRESLKLTAPVWNRSSMSSLGEDFDLIITGSDQIWNSKITKGIDPIYWGDFKRRTQTAMASYAASMENGLDSETADTVASLLNRFDALSVREENLREALQPLVGNKSVWTVVDPTLLLDSSEWKSISSEPLIKEPYLLFYQVRRSELARQCAVELARRRGLKPLFLSAKPELENSPEVAEASPTQFVSLFRDASAVVTTSFHGTAFGIIFEKDFLCVSVPDGKGSRQENLLASLGLSDRIVSEVPQTEMDSIDWDAVRERKAAMLESTYEYLKTCGI